MKRVWIGVGIAAILIVLTIFSLLKVTTTIQSIESEVQDALNFAENGNWQETLQKTDKATELWKSNRPLLNVIQPHDPLELIEVSMAGLRKYAEHEDTEFFQVNGAELLKQLECIRECDTPILGNIF